MACDRDRNDYTNTLLLRLRDCYYGDKMVTVGTSKREKADHRLGSRLLRTVSPPLKLFALWSKSRISLLCSSREARAFLFFFRSFSRFFGLLPWREGPTKNRAII